VLRKTSSSASAPPPARGSAEEEILVVEVEARQACRSPRQSGEKKKLSLAAKRRRHPAYVDAKRERG
jgi:hypothetical protein